jgi:fructosamine-3-kinase
VNDMQREARQQIAVGIERGTLNPREASALMHEYERIEARERKLSRRGLSPREERDLIQDLRRLMAETRSMSSRRHGDNWARNPRGRY